MRIRPASSRLAVAAIALTGFIAASCASAEYVAIASARIANDDVTLEIGVGPCGATHSYEVLKIDGEAVTLRFEILTSKDTGDFVQTCLPLHMVELPEPLNGRQLIDGTTGEPVDVLPFP